MTMDIEPCFRTIKLVGLLTPLYTLREWTTIVVESYDVGHWFYGTRSRNFGTSGSGVRGEDARRLTAQVRSATHPGNKGFGGE